MSSWRAVVCPQEYNIRRAALTDVHPVYLALKPAGELLNFHVTQAPCLNRHVEPVRSALSARR